MISRTFEPDFLNTVANHPEVRPMLAGEGELDLSAAILNPDNFTLVTDGGGFILMRHEPGIYEVHSQFLPEGRKGAIQAMRDGMDYMFTRTDCDQLITQVPDNNRRAVGLARAGSFRAMFRREDAQRGPTTFMGLTAAEWAMGNAELEADGEWFHAQLEAAKEAKGSALPTHAHDEAHERAVGAAVRMAKAGNAAKAVEFYNRWARFAGYVPLTLISEQPIVIDVADAVIGLTARNMEILLCR